MKSVIVVLGLVLFEVISSIDNAIVNAHVLKTIPPKYRRYFLIWGLLLAVVVMRGILPFVIVWLANLDLGLVKTAQLAFTDPVAMEASLHHSKPLLLVGGGVYLVMVFLAWFFVEEKKYAFFVERMAHKLSVWFYAVSSLVITLVIWWCLSHENPYMALAASIGSTVFFLGDGFRRNAEEAEVQLQGPSLSAWSKLLYLEVLDASFSIDGVVGAFAFTMSVPLILIGNGIGAFVVREFTVRGLNVVARFAYLKNGAMYSIGVLGVIMLVESFGAETPFWVAPLTTVVLLVVFLGMSVRELWVSKVLTRVLVLQHPQEKDHTLGTVPLLEAGVGAVRRVGLSWRNLAAAWGADPEGRWAVVWPLQLPAELPPGGNVLHLDRTGTPTDAPLGGLVALDGSWSQAKALWWRNPWLLKLDRIVVRPTEPSIYGRLRREPRPGFVSTLEAVADALVAAGEPAEVRTTLRRAMRTMVQRAGRGRGRITSGGVAGPMDGGERVARVLEAHGVPFLFTLVGGHISPILVGAKRRGIRVVDVRHEATAVFAADAVGRLTGNPGVAAVTAGPGVTNTVTAIKNAALAQSPVVLLGGATATLLRGRGALQDIDQVALLEPHVKWLARPRRVRDVVSAVERAFREASDGVPGPVFVELAIDLLYSRDTVLGWAGPQVEPPPGATFGQRVVAWYVRRHLASVFAGSDTPPSFHAPRLAPPVPPPTAALSHAAAAVASAERPVLVLGSPALRHPERASALASAVERIGVPVWLSGTARGVLGPSHPLLMRHARRDALKRADVVVLAGVPNDFRLDYGRHVAGAKVVGIHPSAADLRLNRRPDVGLVCDVQTALEGLAELVPETPPREVWWAELREREARREAEIATLAAVPTDGRLNPLALCRAVDDVLDDDSVLVGDGGDFVATASYTLRPRGPRSWLDPGVFGTLGMGAGFALAAKLVRPDADVWLLWGDGAAGYSILELDTFVRHGLPIVALVGNDAAWTQILRDQEPLLGDDVACRLAPTDYHVIADGCGAKGFRVSDPADVARVLAEAVTTSRAGTPVLVNALLATTTFRQGSISV